MVFAVIFSIVSAIMLMSAVNSEDWPSTPGMVIDHIIEEDTCASDEIRYIPSIVFSYKVSGQSYNSSSIKAGTGYSCYNTYQQAENQQMFDDYPIGERVVVYYPPRNPSGGVLEVGVSGGSLFFPIFTLILWVLVFMLLNPWFVWFWRIFINIEN